jgi:hypothetical protein
MTLIFSYVLIALFSLIAQQSHQKPRLVLRPVKVRR